MFLSVAYTTEHQSLPARGEKAPRHVLKITCKSATYHCYTTLI